MQQHIIHTHTQKKCLNFNFIIFLLHRIWLGQIEIYFCTLQLPALEKNKMSSSSVARKKRNKMLKMNHHQQKKSQKNSINQPNQPKSTISHSQFSFYKIISIFFVLSICHLSSVRFPSESLRWRPLATEMA